MSDQSALDSESSMACARCGGRTSETASFCQHCGARLALAGGASFGPHEHGGDGAAATRFEPPMRSFAPTDFEGDLDAPPGGAPDSPDAPPNGQGRVPVFSRWRQWGLKSRVGLLFAACVILLGGVAALHRYDAPAISPVIQGGSPKSADGSIAPNGSNPAMVNGAANDGRRALAAPGQGVSGQGTSGLMPDATNPPVANEGGAQTNPTRAGAGQHRNGAKGRAHVRARHHPHRRYWRRPSPNSLYQHADVQTRWWAA